MRPVWLHPARSPDFQYEAMTKYNRVNGPSTSNLSLRFVEVDAIKALAIIGVLILHMSFKSRMTVSALDAIGILQMVFGWAVIAFFFASGLLTRPVQSRAGLTEFAVSRFQRLIVPYLVFSLTYKLLLLMLGLAGIGAVPGEIALADFLFMPVGPQFYFLPLLYVISVVVAAVEIRIRPPLLACLGGLVVVCVYGLIPLPPIGYGASPLLWPLYLFSYVAGRAMSERGPRLRARNLGIVLAFAIGAALLHLAPVILYVCVAPLMFTLFGRYPRAARLIECSRLGKYSSAIYVWHAPVVMPMVSIICFKVFHGSLVMVLPLLVLTISTCILLGGVTRRFETLRFWRF